jgi:curved DNA-binding protein CbpA
LKPLRDQNYFEILEIPPAATKDQIKKAYELAKQTYGDRSAAAYSLFSPEERKAILERVEEAFRTLGDDALRKAYLGQIGAAPAAAAAADRPAPPSIDEMEDLDGNGLRAIRERCHIPLQEVAARTRINIQYLQFIEDDRHDALPAPVYLRSYLVQYAQVVGLDPTAVATKFIATIERRRRASEPPEP